MKPKFFSADGEITGGGKVVKAINLAETAGSAGGIIVYDNTSATGNPVFRFALAANASEFILFPDPGLVFEVGVFIDVVGTTSGNVYF